jgi:beta-lactamase class D
MLDGSRGAGVCAGRLGRSGLHDNDNKDPVLQTIVRAGVVVAVVAALLVHGPTPVSGSGRSSADAQPCFIFSRVHEPTPSVSDPVECAWKSSPASTFKIPHALIALKLRVIAPDTVVRWDGTRQPYASWQRDHTLASAMQSSVVPFFRHTARGIGRDRMREELSAFGYAADSFDGDLTAFWLNGDLAVSPMEQFDFLTRLFAGRLPVERQHVSRVVDAIRMPAGRILLAAGPASFALDWPRATVVRAKTGNTTVDGERVSWLVGALELDAATYVFVARVRSANPLPGTAGADLARRLLNTAYRPR